MLSRVNCAGLAGIKAYKVELEVDLARHGMPTFTMVGLAEGAVKESKERVFDALRNSGFQIPVSRITVNLAPADTRKAGSSYDLPLALGILASANVIDPDALQGWFLTGELSLGGQIKPVPGVLPLALLARSSGAKGLIVPPGNALEAAVVKETPVYAPKCLSDCVALIKGQTQFTPVKAGLEQVWDKRMDLSIDFNEVRGQEFAKRAIEIAAAGGHNLLFIGPPGSGKTMLSKRIPTVLPPLGFEESLEVTAIYSVAGQLSPDQPLVVNRPFRHPHHTISDAGLIGGGPYPRPGEVSMAHHGVLFLDELPEFKKSVLEVLRQPLEDGQVTIARAAASLCYPAEFMLVAAMNPCPCGYLSDERHACRCNPAQIQRYLSRISGPLLDRIDLHVEVPAVPYKDLRSPEPALGSEFMRERIAAARARQTERYIGQGISCNRGLSGNLLRKYCRPSERVHDFMARAVDSLGLSARAFTRVLRLARTIADLEGQEEIRVEDVAEAINYRVLDRRSLDQGS